jgi:predicted DNA-binding transcriptional regulator AlpA
MDWPVSSKQSGVSMKKNFVVYQKKTPTQHELAANPELLKIIRDCKSVVDDTFLKVDQVSMKLAQGVSTTWRDAKSGALPPCIQTNSRSVAWLASEINAVMAARVFASRSGINVNMEDFVAALVATVSTNPSVLENGIKEKR